MQILNYVFMKHKDKKSISQVLIYLRVVSESNKEFFSKFCFTHCCPEQLKKYNLNNKID